MGTICTQPLDKDDCNETVEKSRKKLIQLHGTLAGTISVDLTLGHYRVCKNESLLVLVESQHLQHCDPLKDYTNECIKTVEMIQSMHKTFCKPAVNKRCPYKKLLLCTLPLYKSQESREYRQLFINLLRQALEGTREIAVEFVNTVEGVHTLPNQLLLGLLLGQLISLKANISLNLITTQKKMMSFYRYELIKTERFIIDSTKL